MTPVLRLSDRDNVAVALETIGRGSRIDVDNTSIVARDSIPSGHKIALIDIPAGQQVIKYGSPIGLATTSIEAGDHVHVHNVESTRGRGDVRKDAAPLDLKVQGSE